MSFGAWLRQQRKQVLGLTQAELAHRVACSETTIRKIEKGERRPARDLAERLIRELGIPQDGCADHVAWARGLTGRPSSPSFELSDGVQHVLVPLDAVASFGSEPPTIVHLREPYMGRSQWVPVPLSVVTAFGLQLPCAGEECTGQDPEISGCAKGSVTIDGQEFVDPRTGVVLGMVELRYSRACQTNWVRIMRLCREPLRMEAYLRDQAGGIIEVTRVVVEPPHVYGYGAMCFAPTGQVMVQACGVIQGCDEVRTNSH